ncbi:unnamed protein product [Eruca vesicaria subsp. sativa]|uniref:Uncharacterized protein n=1 Tax=Eruca vesicaria subsp. sativa TaxID=29727 RepID=A0ABC8J0K5_ERUVS|nr:unnamed protein product [Eruca vesicaria subsp. sativa]
MRDLQSPRLQLLFRTLFVISLATLLMIHAFALQSKSEAETAKDVQQHQDGPRHGDLSYDQRRSHVKGTGVT